MKYPSRQTFLRGCKHVICAFLLLPALHITAQQSHEITFQHDGLTVYGTLTTPEGDGKFPIIIINPGSGQNDRDGTTALTDGNSACLFPVLFGDTLRFYKELGEALVDSGYAVLRYDQLLHTYTPAEFGPVTFHKLWLPVESAIEFVKTRADVDTNRIILIGHSEGSSLIPLIAKKRNDVSALISIAGPITAFDSLLAYQWVNLIELLRPCGATDQDSIDAAFNASQILLYFNLIRSDNWDHNTPSLYGAPASAWYDYIRATDSVAINYNEAQLPTLFIGLGKDIQVPPSELERFSQEVTITDDFWSVPGLTHFMTPTIIPHVSQVLTDTIIYWLRQHNLHTSIREPAVDEHHLLKVTPNPFVSAISFRLDMPGAHEGQITISDASGKTVWTKTMSDINNENVLSGLGSLPAGLYHFQLMVNNKLFVQQIIKQ